MSELPRGWILRKVKDAGRVQLGRQRSPDVHEGPNMRPYLRVANVYEDRLKLDDVMEMHFSEEDVRRFELHPGDILLNEGQTPQMLGRPAMYRGELPGACFTNSLIRFQAGGDVEAAFALFLFRHWMRNGDFTALSQITTNIAHLGAGRFASMDMPIPPLAEQRRIVAKLETLQERSRRAREALDSVPPLLEKLRQSILAAAFRGDLTKDWRAKHPNVEPAHKLLERIRTERRKKWEEAELAKLIAKGKPPKDDRWKDRYEEPKPVDANGLPELPRGWCWTTLANLGEDPLQPVQTGPFGALLHSRDYVANGVPVVAVGNIRPNGFREEGLYYVSSKKAEELKRFDVQAGDVLFARSGATTGKACLAPPVARDWRMTGHILRVRLNQALVLPEIVSLALNGSPTSKEAVTGRIRGATRGGFNTGLLEGVPIPLPPRSEQSALLQQIQGLLSTALNISKTNSEAMDNVTNLDQVILAKAFRGEVVPQDPNDEPVTLQEAGASSDAPDEQPAPKAKRSRAAPAPKRTAKRAKR